MSSLADLRTSVARWALATADLVAVPTRVLDDAALIARELDRALSTTIGSIVWTTHRFAPRGLSLVGTAPLGRVIVHTWPEHRALTIDLYGDPAHLDQAIDSGAEGLMHAADVPELP